jgi:hypothetical protein
VSSRYVCDLCGFPDVAWAWTTPNQVTREQAEAGEGWYFEDEVWLICEDCHRLVLDEDEAGLRMRAITNMPPLLEGAFDHPDLQAAIKELRREAVARTHSTFWTHKTTYERIEE